MFDLWTQKTRVAEPEDLRSDSESFLKLPNPRHSDSNFPTCIGSPDRNLTLTSFESSLNIQ